MYSTELRAASAASWTRDYDHVVARRAAASVVEAVMYALRTDGLAAFERANVRFYWSEISPDQMQDVVSRLVELRDQYPTITDELLLELAGHIQ